MFIWIFMFIMAMLTPLMMLGFGSSFIKSSGQINTENGEHDLCL